MRKIGEPATADWVMALLLMVGMLSLMLSFLCLRHAQMRGEQPPSQVPPVEEKAVPEAPPQYYR